MRRYRAYENEDAAYFLSHFTLVNTVLIVINITLFIVIEILGSTEDVELMIRWGASYWPLIYYEHQYYRLLTSAFLHFGLEHLLSNMLILFFIGDHLERALGKIKYLIFYLGCALGSGFVSYEVSMHLEENVVSAGASGAIFGVAGGILYLILKNRGHLGDLSLFQIVMFILFALYEGLQSSGVDNVAHLSGVVIGFFLAMLLSAIHAPGKREGRRIL